MYSPCFEIHAANHLFGTQTHLPSMYVRVPTAERTSVQKNEWLRSKHVSHNSLRHSVSGFETIHWGTETAIAYHPRVFLASSCVGTVYRHETFSTPFPSPNPPDNRCLAQLLHVLPPL